MHHYDISNSLLLKTIKSGIVKKAHGVWFSRGLPERLIP